MKKLLSLVLALAMILLACGAAFAADGDPQLKVTGLTGAVSADYYKVIEWNDTVGWKWAAPYDTAEGFTADLLKEITGTPAKAAVGTEGENGYQPAVEAVTGKITQATANLIAGVANSSKLTGGSLNSSGEWTATISAGAAGAGLYMVVPTGSEDVLFNPVFVASNHGATSPITYDVTDQSGYADGSMAKRSTITVEKEADKYTFNGFVGNDWTTRDGTKPGDKIHFKITTIAPKFADSYTNPVFKVTDQVTAGMKILDSTIVVKGASTLAATNYDLTFDAADPDHFVIALKAAYLKTLTANQTITIEYDAEITNEAPLTVNEEDNTVDVNFSNGPTDTEGHGHKHDGTKHWTFSLDASVLGNEKYQTSELVKIGLKADGTEDTLTTTYSNETQAHALAGATFQLKQGNKVIRTVTTGSEGYIKFDGLDVGTYTLTEVSAPEGYVKDSTDHTVVIAATIAHDYEETASDGCKYLTERLKSYSVTVDGSTTSTYTFDNGTSKTETIGDITTKIGNTPGLELPSTGGIGTTIFYVAGGLLVVGAAVILVARRKAHE